LRGKVPSLQLEWTALRLVEEAASRVRSDYVLENHITVGLPLGSRPGIVPGEARKTNRLVGAFGTVVSVAGVMAGVLLVKYAVLIEHIYTR
jgi:ABC-type molybdate transport system permease subunit